MDQNQPSRIITRVGSPSRSGWQAIDVAEVAEIGDLAQIGEDPAAAQVPADEGRLAAGVEQDAGAHGALGAAVAVGHRHLHPVVVEAEDAPRRRLLAHPRAGGARRGQQVGVERGALDVDGGGLGVEQTVGEREQPALLLVAPGELHPALDHLRHPVQAGVEPQLAQQRHVAGQERLADVEAREAGALDHRHVEPGAGEEEGGGGPGGTAADDEGVVAVRLREVRGGHGRGRVAMLRVERRV